MAVALLGMAAAGVLLPFSNGAAVQVEGARLTLAAKLADNLMERIVATPRSQIGAWAGYSEAQGEVKNAAGVVFTDPMYANFSRSVSCDEDVYVPQEDKTSLLSDFLLVSVHVRYQGRVVATLDRLISK